MDTKKYLSPYIREMEPYVPGYQPESTEGLIKLNTNENPYPPSPKAVAAMEKVLGAPLRLYPSYTCEALRSTISMVEGLPGSEYVFVGNGSDEVLAFCYPAFFRQEKPIAFFNISYGFYKVYCGLFQVRYQAIPLEKGFRAPVEIFCGQYGGILIANPNAPTGLPVPLTEVEGVLKRNPDCVVVVDEAYVMFGGESAVDLIPRYSNLLVIRTLSKSHSLAGLRAAFAMGQPHLIQGLFTVRDSFNSYNLGSIALAGAEAALLDNNYAKENAGKIMETRDWMIGELRELGYWVTDSKTNFIFASPPDQNAKGMFETLREQNIHVRYFSNPDIEAFLRISIGTRQEMETVLSVIKKG